MLVACDNALLEVRSPLAAVPTEVATGGLGGLGGLVAAVLLVALRGRDLHPTDRRLIFVLGGCVGMLVGVPLTS